MKCCWLMDSDKSNLLWKDHLLLKSGFQVITFFILLEVEYLVTNAVYIVYKWTRQLVLWKYKVISDLLYFGYSFPIRGVISLSSRGCTIFQIRIPKQLLQNCKVANTCESKKRWCMKIGSVQVLIFWLKCFL